MILSGNTIKKQLEKNILIENGNMQNVQSASYDLTSGDFILKIVNKSKAVSLIDASAIDNLYEQINITAGYEFKPGECIIVPLIDKFNMPSDVCASIRGKTSFNRLAVFLTSQHINAGYCGKLNITLVNNSQNTYILMPNMQIAQVVFEKLDENVENELLYPNQANASYQNEDGLQGSKVYNSFIGKVVRHFKGNYYYIENICMDSETKESIIVYRTLYNRQDSNIWTRSAKMFFEEIDANRKDNVTGQKHRFEVVDELTIDYTKLNKNN